MPLKAKRSCRYPGCPKPSTDGWCEEHRRRENKRSWRERNQLPRESSSTRGYDADWQQFRRVILIERPLCEQCAMRGRVQGAVLLHHIQPIETRPDLRLDSDNVQSLCRECHERVHGRKV